MSYIYLRAGRVQDAIKTMEDVVRSDGTYVPALMLLAQMYNSQKRLDEAISLYEKVIKIDPSVSDAYLFLGYSMPRSRGMTMR